MKKLLIAIIAIAAILWWQNSGKITSSTNGISFQYTVKYPTSNNGYLPMLIALHGNGDTPNNFYEDALDQLTTESRVILVKAPFNKSWPYNSDDFKEYGEALADITKQLSKKYKTRGKPVLLGFSGGGMMAYQQAFYHGDTYSTIIPVSAKYTQKWIHGEMSNTTAKIIAFHGNKDNVVGYKAGQYTFELAQQITDNAMFNTIEGDHLAIFRNAKADITKTVHNALKEI